MILYHHLFSSSPLVIWFYEIIIIVHFIFNGLFKNWIVRIITIDLFDVFGPRVLFIWLVIQVDWLYLSSSILHSSLSVTEKLVLVIMYCAVGSSYKGQSPCFTCIIIRLLANKIILLFGIRWHFCAIVFVHVWKCIIYLCWLDSSCLAYGI